MTNMWHPMSMQAAVIIVCIIMAIAKTDVAGFELKHEPDYHHLLYGSVWRHIVYAPAANSLDVEEATKHLHHILEQLEPSLAATSPNLLCISQNVLWYTETGQFPLTFDSYVLDSDGYKHLVSVPFSFGSTFTFLLTSNDKINQTTSHTFTITKDNKRRTFSLYSHTTNFLEDEVVKRKHTTWACIKEKATGTSYSNIILPLLSTLASSRYKENYAKDSCEVNSNIHKQQGKEIISDEEKIREGASNWKYQESRNEESGSSFTDSTDPVQEPDSKKRSGANIKVMTYNIWNFNSYRHTETYSQRVKRIVKVLKEARPDIVGFQEVRYEQASGGRLGPNQVWHLVATLPGYQFVYQPAQLFRESFEKGRSEEGLAIFSKYPIIYHEYLLLFRNNSNSADSHQRICLHAVINVDDVGRVHVYNTHLSLSHEAREASVLQILQFICESSHGEPALLLGDLNATPEEKAIHMLSNGTWLTDVWEKLHPESKGFTFNTLEDHLSKRIDYIFMGRSQDVTALKAEVLPDQIKYVIVKLKQICGAR